LKVESFFNGAPAAGGSISQWSFSQSEWSVLIVPGGIDFGLGPLKELIVKLNRAEGEVSTIGASPRTGNQARVRSIY
jgi:hypothetical protein